MFIVFTEINSLMGAIEILLIHLMLREEIENFAVLTLILLNVSNNK